MSSAQRQSFTLDSGEQRRFYEEANRLYHQAQKNADDKKLQQALKLALQARALEPTHIPCLNLLSRIELKRHNYAAAEFWVEQGLQLKPQSASLLYSAGHIALSQERLNEAEQYFRQSVQISRVATKSLNALAHIKYLQGEYVEAFQYYRELSKTQTQDIELRSQLFSSCEKLSADYYSDELEQDLLRFFSFPNMDYSQLRSLSCSLLTYKLRLSEFGCPLNIEELACDSLLLNALNHFYFTDPIFERLFITIRKSLLIASSNKLAIDNQFLPLVEALAKQCWLNESIWYITEQEHLLVDQLEQLSDRILQLNEHQSALPSMLLVLMYKPLAQCKFIHHLDGSAIESSVIKTQLDEYQALNNQQKTIASIGESSNEISLRVQKQYHENPYPRWLEIGYNQTSNYGISLEQAFPQQPFYFKNKKINLLVAGCGTGRHALRLAKYFQDLNVTAIDLSFRSLAYAKHKASQHPELAVEFLQGDILNLQHLNASYDVIECSGVLHHMQNPILGLQCLSEKLKPKGLIKIALYSKVARRKVTELRNLLGNPCDKDISELRLIRESLLQKVLPGDWQDIYSSNDFYTSSNCRDLLFHTQEHLFDAIDLPEFLAQAGLKFVGMLTPPEGKALLQQLGKEAGKMSIEEWHELEQEHPYLFAQMYQFYAVRI